MKPTNLKTIAGAFALMAFVGCVDDNYDLSDIDTTVRVQVKDLVIPVNLDAISLSSIISETDEIQNVDGLYAYVTDGDFKSEGIKVEAVHINSSEIAPSNININLKNLPSIAGTIPFDIPLSIGEQDLSTYTFGSDNIDSSIEDLTHIEANFKITLKLDLSSFTAGIDKMKFNDLKFMLPKNFTGVTSNPAGTYDSNTGILSMNNNIELGSADPNFQITVEATGLSAGEGEFDGENHSFHTNGVVGIESVTLVVPEGTYVDLSKLSSPKLVINYNFPGFDVTSVNGTFHYKLDDINIPEVSLNDIPDFLTQQGTNLKLRNPQIYIEATNPLYEYSAFATANFEITPLRSGSAGRSISLDKGAFKIGGVKGQEKFDFCFSPIKPEGHANVEWYAFTELGNVLAGDGLPTSLKIELVNPQIPSQSVENFKLNCTYPAVEGTYKLIAPFDLAQGAQIVYRGTEDGWASDDLDKLVIEKLDVNLSITTDIGVEAQIKAYPLDKNGNQINNVMIEGATIPAGAKKEPVHIRITGTIRDLDGIKYEATVSVPNTNGGSIGPDMTIMLEDIRPCVSGYYEDEL